jgi:hypothetical protein
MKFIHKFNRSLSCEVLVSDTPPEKGQSHIQSIEWTGRPKRKHVSEYVRFCHVVNSHLADHWQISLPRIVQTSPTIWECWEYPERFKPLAGNLELFLHIRSLIGFFPLDADQVSEVLAGPRASLRRRLRLQTAQGGRLITLCKPIRCQSLCAKT